jgi:hypothetical protein
VLARAKTALEGLVDLWLAGGSTKAPTTGTASPTPQPQQAISKPIEPNSPNISEYIRKASWTSYVHKGEPAKSDEEGWCFRDDNPELADFILKHGRSAKDLETGFELRFSGVDEKLIARRKLKPAK